MVTSQQILDQQVRWPDPDMGFKQRVDRLDASDCGNHQFNCGCGHRTDKDGAAPMFDVLDFAFGLADFNQHAARTSRQGASGIGHLDTTRAAHA